MSENNYWNQGVLTEEAKKEIDKCSEITTLFDYWEKVQECDPNYDDQTTGIHISSFTEDGIVDKNKWETTEKGKKVLYILREANGSRSIVDGKVDKGNFWFKECIENNIGLDNRIFKRIVQMQKIIEVKGNDTEVLKQTAFMNINKRGGLSAVDWKVLNNYAITYKDFIKKEIEIIDPDIIVCCGTYWTLVDQIYGVYDKQQEEWKDRWVYTYKLKLNNKDVVVYNMWHPSARKSNEGYTKRFDSIYNHGNCKKLMEKIDIKAAIEIVKEILSTDNDIKVELWEMIKGYKKDILEKYEFRNIRPEEADQAVSIEQDCFPPHEACSERHMKERITKAPELFLVAVDRKTGKLAGFLNGLSTDENSFRDEFFTDAELYNPEGKILCCLV